MSTTKRSSTAALTGAWKNARHQHEIAAAGTPAPLVPQLTRDDEVTEVSSDAR